LIPELGLIEGFFGRPWSWEERAEAVSFLAPHGYRFFLYAPKADAYLRRQWQAPHPDAELEAMARFAAHCRSRGVRFGVGLSPFELHLAPGRDWQEPLARKLAHLDKVRPDDLAILFDDMRGDVPQLSERQAAIIAFAAERTRATRVLCCPTYYSDDPVLDSAFGTRPSDYLPRLGRLLDPAVELFWTGPETCSHEITPGHVARVAELIGRKPFLWDNYPVNDGARMSQHLHLRAFTGRRPEIAGLIAGHGVNPASQALLSRIPALTLAQLYREGARYDYALAFVEAATQVLGQELTATLRGDIIAFQDRGRDRLGARRAVLRERYASIAHPAAQEIAAWLDGQWNVADDLVQTQ
jgi:hyaluronoglucosaminidase